MQWPQRMDRRSQKPPLRPSLPLPIQIELTALRKLR
jgi:hypothetical protein